MTELDHSSPASLIAGLGRRRGSVFRFRHRDGLSARWKLKSAVPVASDGVRLRIGYFGLRHGGRNGKSDGDITLTLGGGRSVFGNYPMTVMVEDDPTPVDACRDRLDENLQGVFS